MAKYNRLTALPFKGLRKKQRGEKEGERNKERNDRVSSVTTDCLPL